jgi:hypothetical protein
MYDLIYKYIPLTPDNQRCQLLVGVHAILVTQCGDSCINKPKINFGAVFTGQIVGIREVADRIWLPSFLDRDPRFFNKKRAGLSRPSDLFAPEKVLTMSPV